jgi:hypothetical protein
MRTKFERTTKQSAVPCITAIHHIRNPEEDFAKPTQPKPGEGNAQRSKAQCRASRQSIISGIRRRIPAKQHSLSKAEAISSPPPFSKPPALQTAGFFIIQSIPWRLGVIPYQASEPIVLEFNIHYSLFNILRRSGFQLPKKPDLSCGRPYLLNKSVIFIIIDKIFNLNLVYL